VAPKTGAKDPMSDVAHITDLTRAAAEQLVRCEERRHGSRMTAYEIVADRAGLKADWLRKFIGRSPRAALSLPAFVNLFAMYDRLCSRVEQEYELERARIVALKGEIDAATPGHLAMVLDLAGQGSSAARTRQGNSQER
jgi:hypothetical protein